MADALVIGENPRTERPVVGRVNEGVLQELMTGKTASATSNQGNEQIEGD